MMHRRIPRYQSIAVIHNQIEGAVMFIEFLSTFSVAKTYEMMVICVSTDDAAAHEV